jgi:hypothetical protein
MLVRWKPGEPAYIDAGAERQPKGRGWTVRAGGKSRLHSLSAGLLALALLVAPDADKAGCGNLADRYRAAVAEVADALGVYAKCVAASDKREDCAAQMQALDNAHDNFADAVADAKACQ